MQHILIVTQDFMESVFADSIRGGDDTFFMERDNPDYEIGDTLYFEKPKTATEKRILIKAIIKSIFHNDSGRGIPEGYCILGVKGKAVDKKAVPYVEDLSCLDDYTNLQIDHIRFSGDHVLPHRSMTIQWSSNIGFGELQIGLDSDGMSYMDTECMGGEFVRAIMTLFFLEANPHWDPRPKKINTNES